MISLYGDGIVVKKDNRQYGARPSKEGLVSAPLGGCYPLGYSLMQNDEEAKGWFANLTKKEESKKLVNRYLCRSHHPHTLLTVYRKEPHIYVVKIPHVKPTGRVANVLDTKGYSERRPKLLTDGNLKVVEAKQYTDLYFTLDRGRSGFGGLTVDGRELTPEEEEKLRNTKVPLICGCNSAEITFEELFTTAEKCKRKNDNKNIVIQ